MSTRFSLKSFDYFNTLLRYYQYMYVCTYYVPNFMFSSSTNFNQLIDKLASFHGSFTFFLRLSTVESRF